MVPQSLQGSLKMELGGGRRVGSNVTGRKAWGWSTAGAEDKGKVQEQRYVGSV